MNIARIFHVYFGFIMLITTFSLIGSKSDMWQYLEHGYVSVIETGLVGEEKGGHLDSRGEALLENFVVDLKQDLTKSFVTSGQRDYENLKLEVTGEGELKGFKLALIGDDVVARAKIVVNGNVYEGKRERAGFVFNNLKMSLSGEAKEMVVRLDIGQDAESGDRFGVGLNEGAFKIKAGFKQYFFPIEALEKRVYFSVVGKN